MRINDLPVSVVVPFYYREETSGNLVDRLDTVVKELVFSNEVMLVNDGSKDRSWQVIQVLTQNIPTVRGINLRRNYSQHNALLASIREEKYEVLVTLGDDLLNPPEEIPRMLADLSQGYDMI